MRDSLSHTHHVTKFIHLYGDVVHPQAILLTEQFDHLDIFFPYCSPMSFFLLEINRMNGIYSNYTPVLPDQGDWLLCMHRLHREKSQDTEASHSRHPTSRDNGHLVLISCYIDTSSGDGIYGLCYIHGPPTAMNVLYTDTASGVQVTYLAVCLLIASLPLLPLSIQTVIWCWSS